MNNNDTYNGGSAFSAVFMICALLWLTICAPFVFASQQREAAKSHIAANSSPVDGAEEECPVGSAEEKTPGSGSLAEEYLHEQHVEESFLLLSLRYQKCENADDYLAYHGEVQVPPPNSIFG